MLVEHFENDKAFQSAEVEEKGQVFYPLAPHGAKEMDEYIAASRNFPLKHFDA